MGADVNARDKNKVTPLHNAVLHSENLEVAKTLIQLGAYVNARSRDGTTPIRAAVLFNKGIDIIKILIKSGANVNISNKFLLTPLHSEAGGNQNLEIINALINAGADINVKDNSGNTPFDVAKFSNASSKVINVLRISPSPELQKWLDLRKSAIECKNKFAEDGGHMSLSSHVVDPNELPESIRTEALKYLNIDPKRETNAFAKNSKITVTAHTLDPLFETKTTKLWTATVVSQSKLFHFMDNENIYLTVMMNSDNSNEEKIGCKEVVCKKNTWNSLKEEMDATEMGVFSEMACSLILSEHDHIDVKELLKNIEIAE